MLIFHGMKNMGSWACIIALYSLMGSNNVLAEVPSHATRWASAPIVSFPIIFVGLLVATPAMLAYWAYYLFSWAYWLYFYLLMCPRAY